MNAAKIKLIFKTLKTQFITRHGTQLQDTEIKSVLQFWKNKICFNFDSMHYGRESNFLLCT